MSLTICRHIPQLEPTFTELDRVFIYEGLSVSCFCISWSAANPIVQKIEQEKGGV